MIIMHSVIKYLFYIVPKTRTYSPPFQDFSKLMQKPIINNANIHQAIDDDSKLFKW